MVLLICILKSVCHIPRKSRALLTLGSAAEFGTRDNFCASEATTVLRFVNTDSVSFEGGKGKRNTMQQNQAPRSSSCEKCLHIRKLRDYRTL